MIDCEDVFKDNCYQVPKNFSLFNGISALGKEQLKSLIEFEQEICNQHNGEERTIVCLECREVVCVRCLFEGHQSHLWSEVEEIVKLFQKFNGLDELKISGCLSDVLDRKRKLFVEKVDFLHEVEASEDAIIKAGQDLKDLVDRHTEALVSELTQLKMRKLGDIENERQEVEKELKVLEYYSSEIVEKLAEDNHCIMKTAFKMKPADGQDGLSQACESPCSRATMIAFQEASILEQLRSNGSNLIGRLKAEFDLKDRRTEDNVLSSLSLIDFPDDSVGFKSTTTENEECHVNAQLTAVLDTGECSVFGVAAMQSHIYVLQSNAILVFEAHEPFERLNVIKATNFLYPFDLAACPRNLCLYVTDDGYGCVWKVDNDHKVTKWLQGIGEPSTISVCIHTGHVSILTSGQPSRLEVFDPNGERVNRFHLADDVTEPQHAVATPSGDTFICFRQKNSKVWGICSLTPEGHESVRCELRDAFHHLASTPCHLALDELDHLFVADWQRKIDLFDSQLNWDRTLLSSQRDGIERPERICYDRINRLLVVVHSWGKKTNVYRYISKQIPNTCQKLSRW